MRANKATTLKITTFLPLKLVLIFFLYLCCHQKLLSNIIVNIVQMKTFKFAETSVFLHDQDLPNLLDHTNEIGVEQKQLD